MPSYAPAIAIVLAIITVAGIALAANRHSNRNRGGAGW